MNLEEDAMLVAIGEMSMEEARDKWADDWNKFIQALTRWKSVHQLLRLGQLLKLQYQLTNDKAYLALQQFNHKEILNHLEIVEYNLSNFTLLDFEADKHAMRYIPDPNNDGDTMDAAEEIIQRLGKNRKLKYDWKTDVYIWNFHSRYDKDYDEAIATLERFEDAIQYRKIEKRKIDKQLAETEKNLHRAQDQYDITKPYAMGLLVADIFYSLAAALQGDIY